MTVPSIVSVTYFPADCGSIIPGKSKAPEAFRTAGLISKLQTAGLAPIEEHHALAAPARYSVADFTIGSVRNKALNLEACERAFATISANLSATSTSAPPFQLVIGGECCQLPAVLSAISKSPVYMNKRIGLVYIDADLDLTSPTDTDSTGYFAGMTMTHLLQLPGALDAMKQFSRPNGKPVCDASNTVFFGTNMENPGNRREHLGYLFDNGFKLISSKSVASEPESAARAALAYMQEKVDVIFVHLDVDSIDPRLFPLANVPNFTGVGFETMMLALSVLMESEKLCGLMIAEVNPDHDPELEMVASLTDGIVGMLGSRRAALGR